MLGGRRRTNSDRILSLEAATLEIYSLLLRYLDSHRRRISLFAAWEEINKRGFPFWCKGRAEPSLERCLHRGSTWLAEWRRNARVSVG
ncbi:hypothetical protein ES288_A11G337500v1 [Gossypium darwinii]|uniref:Uncharacterized protein n=1 Tax=Gossypium darwinii TaxID=34276 RepID=A0A5D2ESJ0_GOSDA|nr:hypothetical protein ES288_A11G337500v1 [Gossypium darwinii]